MDIASELLSSKLHIEYNIHMTLPIVSVSQYKNWDHFWPIDLHICKSHLAFCEPQWATAELEGFIVELTAPGFQFLEMDYYTLSNL